MSKSKPTMRDKFDKDFGDKDSVELQREILYQMYKSNNIAEKTRSNTNTLIIWLVVLPVIAGVILLFIRGALDA